MRAGIYGRNSASKAKSIADQLKLGRLTASDQGWQAAGEYSDGTKASKYRTKERKDWPTLVADLTSGALDVLVIWNVARGSRDELDWFPLLRICEDRGTLVHVIAHRRTYDPRISRDWKTLAEEGVNAAHYSRELSENVSRGIRLSAVNEDGAGPHGRPSYGQSVAYDPETKRPLRVTNSDAVLVREIFGRLDKHTPVSKLVADLNARGIPSPRGGRWERKTIRVIARNVAYIGMRRFDGELRRAQWEPIVEEDQFWRVQGILDNPKRKTTRAGRYLYLLSWLAETPCGSRLRGHPEVNRPVRYVCEREGCVSIRVADADEVVSRIVLGRLQRVDARERLARRDDATAAAAAEAKRLRSQLEDARRSFEAPDGISAEALARKERTLIPLIEDADRRGRPTGTAGVIDDLMKAADPAACWAGFEMAARREVLSTVATIRVGKSTRRLRHTASTDERLLEAAHRFAGSTWVGDDTVWGAPE